jgi:hypothetical protein
LKKAKLGSNSYLPIATRRQFPRDRASRRDSDNSTPDHQLTTSILHLTAVVSIVSWVVGALSVVVLSKRYLSRMSSLLCLGEKT